MDGRKDGLREHAQGIASAGAIQDGLALKKNVDDFHRRDINDVHTVFSRTQSILLERPVSK